MHLFAADSIYSATSMKCQPSSLPPLGGGGGGGVRKRTRLTLQTIRLPILRSLDSLSEALTCCVNDKQDQTVDMALSSSVEIWKWIENLGAQEQKELLQRILQDREPIRRFADIKLTFDILLGACSRSGASTAEMIALGGLVGAVFGVIGGRLLARLVLYLMLSY